MADEITVSVPFLRALVALSVSKSTRSLGADTVISSALPSQLILGDLRSFSIQDSPGAVFGKPARSLCIPTYFVMLVWRPGCVGREESADETDLVRDAETKCEAQ